VAGQKLDCWHGPSKSLMAGCNDVRAIDHVHTNTTAERNGTYTFDTSFRNGSQQVQRSILTMKSRGRMVDLLHKSEAGVVLLFWPLRKRR
jgi:hypothetical protein